MLTEAQLEWRRGGIGSSEVGVLAGHSMYRNATPFAVWSSKIYGDFTETTDAMEIGNVFEEPISRLYLMKMGDDSLRVHKARCRVHPKHRWARATPDYYVKKYAPLASRKAGMGFNPAIRLLECKFVGPGMEHHYDTDHPTGIPDMIYDQVTWQMWVCGANECDVAALFASQRRLFVWRIPFDPTVASGLEQIAAAFWRDHVLAEVPPPIDGSQAASCHLATRYPTQGYQLELAPAAAETPAEFDATYRKFLADAKSKREEARNLLKSMIGDNMGIQGPWGKATWKEQRGEVDWKKAAQLLGAKLLDLGVFADHVQKVIEDCRGPSRRVLRVKLCEDPT